MLKTIEHKLYLRPDQERTLEGWLSRCCWVYNRALEHRIKAYKRRGESVNYYRQQAMLTQWRDRIESLGLVPTTFERDALRRVDRGFKAFFRRLKAGEMPGFPRFRSHWRYNSLEQLGRYRYARAGSLFIPKLGEIRSRGRAVPDGEQIGIRIIRRANGWFAQILVDDGKTVPTQAPVASSIGVDVGLSAFATLSDGTGIENPRWLSRSAQRLRHEQRRVSRRMKGSRNRRKAANRLRRVHERVAAQRRNFCHQHSTALVRQYNLIAVENLNVSGMVRSRFGKSILDCAWSTFTAQLAYKAANAGRQFVAVNPRGTSQECPGCGAVKPKQLSERKHICRCGVNLDRDHAAACVILARALRGHGGETPVEGRDLVGSAKQEGKPHDQRK